VVNPAILPADAARHGTTDSIVQRLRSTVAVVRFVREIWDVPMTHPTITALSPPGYRGGFCHAIPPSATGRTSVSPR